MRSKLQIGMLIAATVALLLLVGCKSNDARDHTVNDPPMQSNLPPTKTENPPPVTSRPPLKSQTPPSDQQQQMPQRKYEGPPVKVLMLQQQTYPPQNNVGIEVTAPTSGWTLALDKGEIVGDVAKVYLTLERPAEDEIVTQALVKLNANFKTTEAITTSEIYIHMAQRGVSTLTTDYRLAKVAH